MTIKVSNPVQFDSIQLGKDLRAYQARQALTLNEVAKLTGINVPTLSRIRNGKENALFIEVSILALMMGYKMGRYIVAKKTEKTESEYRGAK